MSFLTKVGYLFKKMYRAVYIKEFNFKLILIFKCYQAKKVIGDNIPINLKPKIGTKWSIWSDLFTPFKG